MDGTFSELGSDPSLDALAVPDPGPILVVDDHEANLVAVESALAPLRRTLVFAQSGLEALKQLLEQDFALIILDIAMPGMDGFEVARMVRSRERNHETPIIFLTVISWEDEAVLRGYELGAVDFLTKPIRAEVLRAKANVFVQLQERTIEARMRSEQLRVRDLEEQRRRFEAEAMERQLRALAEADRKKDEFLAILSHELRSPLQPLHSALDVIDDAPDRPLSSSIRTVVRHQVHHLTRLVDDLLDIARFTAGKLELQRELVELEQIVVQAVESCSPAIVAREHQLTMHSMDATAIVHGDPVRLVQIVANLIHNAAKYTRPGGLIEVAWGIDGEHAFVRVSDNGQGLPDELIPRIFDMFVQERTAPSGAGGLGLGLGLVKRLVELHGGTVHAWSEGRDRGSVFETRLPLASRTSDAIVVPRTRTAPRRLPLRTVICDDAPDLRWLIADLLRLRGHDVSVVADGREAVNLIVAEKPDVALIDIGLPEMDGYAVARAVRRELNEPRPRLIAMTGFGRADDRVLAFDAGFDAHLLKPASVDKILRAMYGNED